MKRNLLFAAACLFLFLQGNAQNKTFMAGVMLGSPMKPDGGWGFRNDNNVKYYNEGKEKVSNLNYGVWVAYFPKFLNPTGNKNAFEFRYSQMVLTKKWDYQSVETHWGNEQYTFLRYYTFKETSPNISLAFKHYEKIGKLSLFAGAGIDYIKYRKSEERTGHNYWDASGNWLGTSVTTVQSPSVTVWGLSLNTGVSLPIVASLSVTAQLNMGFYRARMKDTEDHWFYQYYWDNWNWIYRNTYTQINHNSTLYYNTPIIPEIRLAWSFDIKKAAPVK